MMCKAKEDDLKSAKEMALKINSVIYLPTKLKAWNQRSKMDTWRHLVVLLSRKSGIYI